VISLSHRFERFREKTKTRSFHEEKANCGREFDSLLQAKGLCTTEFWARTRFSMSGCSVCRRVGPSVAAEQPRQTREGITMTFAPVRGKDRAECCHRVYYSNWVAAACAVFWRYPVAIQNENRRWRGLMAKK